MPADPPPIKKPPAEKTTQPPIPPAETEDEQ